MATCMGTCAGCNNRDCFGYANLIIPQETSGTKSQMDSCGLLTGEQFIAQIIGSCSETQGPVTVVQKRLDECKVNNGDFHLFERKYDGGVYENPYNPVCRIIRKNEDSVYCKRCAGYGERVSKIIFDVPYYADVNERMRKLEELCRQDDEKNDARHKLNIKVTTTGERNHPDRIYLRYQCPITKFTEIAIPFSFNKAYRLVVFLGRHFMQEDYEIIGSELDRFFVSAEHEGIVVADAEYIKLKNTREDCVRRERKIKGSIPGALSPEELRGRIVTLFECLGKVKRLMDEMLVAKTHNQMDRALQKAFDEFKVMYKFTQIHEGSYYTDAENRIKNLDEAAKKAVDVLAGQLGIKIILFLPTAVRIQEGDAITLRPQQATDVPYENIVISDGRITQGKEYTEKKTDRARMFRIFPFAKDGDIKAVSEFPVAFAVHFDDVPDAWRDKDGVPHTEVRMAFSMILSAFAQHIRAEGVEIQAAFNAMRIQQFSSILRHEIGQKTAMMKQRYAQYLQYLNEHYVKKITDINSPDWAWYGGNIDPFKQNLRTFINNTMTHVYLVSVMSNTGRYLKGIPNPEKKLFAPYGEILFKWRDMFEGACADAYLHCPFPGIEKIMESHGRWTAFPKMYADAGQIEQVAYNLTTNAIKYSLRYTTFSIDCRCSSDRTRYELIVKNHSLPITEENQIEIFKYGRRVEDSEFTDGTRSKEKDGDGLGLYISRQIAEKHDGSLIISKESANRICDYNIPLLVLLDKLPEEWQPGGNMATEDGKNPNKIEKLRLAYRAWTNPGDGKKRSELSEIVHPEIIKVLDGQMPLDKLIEKWAKTQEKIQSLEKAKGRWLSTFYNELRKPTAKITFTMSIPM